jgi:hypothetical protein
LVKNTTTADIHPPYTTDKWVIDTLGNKRTGQWGSVGVHATVLDDVTIQDFLNPDGYIKAAFAVPTMSLNEYDLRIKPVRYYNKEYWETFFKHTRGDYIIDPDNQIMGIDHTGVGLCVICSHLYWNSDLVPITGFVSPFLTLMDPIYVIGCEMLRLLAQANQVHKPQIDHAETIETAAIVAMRARKCKKCAYIITKSGFWQAPLQSQQGKLWDTAGSQPAINKVWTSNNTSI